MKQNSQQTGLSDTMDNIVLGFGRFLSWANGILVLVIVLQVTLRYGFGRGLVLLEELEWHLYGLAFMFGLSYALVTDAHVRVDIIHGRFSKRTQAWIEILGILFILMPFIVLLIIYGIEFFYDSWSHHESSSAPMGLCCRWAIKAVIPLSFGMLGFAAFSRLIRAMLSLKRKENGSS